MKRIPLTQGKFALVDDEDFEELNKHKWNAHKEGRVFYALRGKRVNGKNTVIRMHRVIIDAPKGKLVDHIDRDGLNNQRENLRLCSRSENAMNSKKRSDNSSGYTGVSFEKCSKKYRAYINIDKKLVRLGRFYSAKEAAKAYDKAAIEHHGEYATLNFPDGIL